MDKVKEYFNEWFLNFGNYFKYNLKNCLKTILLIIAFGVVVYIIPLSDVGAFKSTTNVGLIITYVGVLCYIVPIFQMNYLKRKKILDCYYSLPIDKKGIIANNYVSGLLQIIVPYVILYWAGFLIVFSNKIASFYRFEYYVPLFFLVLLFVVALYSINTFIVSQNNTNIDACISLVFWTFLVAIILWVVENCINSFARGETLTTLHYVNLDPVCFVLFYPLVSIGNYYNKLIIQNKYLNGNYNYWDVPKLDNVEIASYIVLIVMGIIAIVLIIIFANKHKAENAEEISLSPFSYFTYLPVYLFCSIFIISFEGADMFIWIFILLAVYLIFKVIQYRKIKLSPKILILPLIILVCALIFGTIFRGIESYFVNNI